MYGTVAETARRWGISERRVRLLCAQGRVPGAIREGRSWLIPAEAVKPLDARRRRGEDRRFLVRGEIISGNP